MPKVNDKPLNFEQSLQDLEVIVAKLEAGELSLEDALKYFEEGIKLTTQCQDALNQAEQKIKILTANDDKHDLKPYDADCTEQ